MYTFCFAVNEKWKWPSVSHRELGFSYWLKLCVSAHQTILVSDFALLLLQDKMAEMIKDLMGKSADKDEEKDKEEKDKEEDKDKKDI